MNYLKEFESCIEGDGSDAHVVLKVAKKHTVADRNNELNEKYDICRKIYTFERQILVAQCKVDELLPERHIDIHSELVMRDMKA